MHVDFLLDVFRGNQEKQAIVWRDESYAYAWLIDAVERWGAWLEKEGVKSGTIVALEADFSPDAIGLFLALIDKKCIVTPLTTSVEANKSEFRQISQVEVVITVNDKGEPTIQKLPVTVSHEILRQLQREQHPGLVLFSSGSTGKSKAAVHDLVPLLEKFKLPRNAYRTIAFLLFDHIGGINTLLYILANAGCIVTLSDRSPDSVCAAIQRHKVELLPTSPTFINLLLVSEAYKRYDLSSLKTVTYGTEMMPESTLRRFHELFPDVRLLQTYGLSEVGILRSKSRSSDSLWVKIGGEGFETRVVDGMLEIRAQSAMRGYLNAESPFTDDGWFRTGDSVEVDGEFVRFLGRQSEIINIGGEKVYPAEVESVIQLMDGVEEVVVVGESHPITGQIVLAKVKLSSSETDSDFRKRMRLFCYEKLERFKVPQKLVVVSENLHGERFKKMRR